MMNNKFIGAFLIGILFFFFSSCGGFNGDLSSNSTMELFTNSSNDDNLLMEQFMNSSNNSNSTMELFTDGSNNDDLSIQLFMNSSNNDNLMMELFTSSSNNFILKPNSFISYKLSDNSQLRIYSNATRPIRVTINEGIIKSYDSNLFKPLGNPVFISFSIKDGYKRARERNKRTLYNTEEIYIKYIKPKSFFSKLNINDVTFYTLSNVDNTTILKPIIPIKIDRKKDSVGFVFKIHKIINNGNNNSIALIPIIDSLEEFRKPLKSEAKFYTSPVWFNYPITPYKDIYLTFNKDLSHNLKTSLKNFSIKILDSRNRKIIQKNIKIGDRLYLGFLSLPGKYKLVLMTNLKRPFIINNIEVLTIFILQSYFIVDFNDSKEDYMYLVYKYSPIVEFGNTNFFSNINSSLASKLAKLYDEYKKEYYIPICLDDIPVYIYGEMSYKFNKKWLPYWLQNQNFFPKKLIFGVKYRSNFYPTKLQYIWEFYSGIDGFFYQENSPDYFYTVKFEDQSGNIRNNGAQYLTKDFIFRFLGVPSCIYATIQTDEDFIYLQYWFYYPYDPKTPGFLLSKIFAQHIGDNEFLEVVLDKETLKPLYVFLAHHNNNQKFAYMDKNGETFLFEWNIKGFNNGNGIGGAIVSWDKIHKYSTHPIVYVALGSHGIYPRRGIYTVDQPFTGFSIDLEEVVGGGGRIFYTSKDQIQSLEDEGYIKIITNPIGGDFKYKYLLSPLSTEGESFAKKIFQNEVRFFPYSNFYYSNLKCFKKVSEISSDYDVIFNGIKLKVLDKYCKDIILDSYLFPDKNIFQNVYIVTNGRKVYVKGTINLKKRKSKEILSFIKDSYGKLLVNWGDSEVWEQVDRRLMENIISFKILPFSIHHTYNKYGNYTVTLRFLVENKGVYIDKTLLINLKETPNMTGRKFFKWLFQYKKVFFKYKKNEYVCQIKDHKGDSLVYYDCKLNELDNPVIILRLELRNDDIVYMSIYDYYDVSRFSEGCIKKFEEIEKGKIKGFIYDCERGNFIDTAIWSKS